MLAKILYDDRISRQFDPREPEETDMIVSTMLPQLRSVPTDQFYECYVVAMENRPEGNTYPISGGELLMAWHVIERRKADERVESQRLLPENAAGACGRCGKDGREIMLDGTVGGMCDHRPITEEEKAEAARLKEERLASMRAEARRNYEAKLKGEAKAKAESPKPQILRCSTCQREVNPRLGWKAGDTCGVPLKTNDVCPNCKEKTGVLSGGRMVCRDCFHIYGHQSCVGVLEVPWT